MQLLEVTIEEDEDGEAQGPLLCLHFDVGTVHFEMPITEKADYVISAFETLVSVIKQVHNMGKTIH